MLRTSRSRLQASTSVTGATAWLLISALAAGCTITTASAPGSDAGDPGDPGEPPAEDTGTGGGGGGGCTDSCAGKECGTDACGRSCGSCSTGFVCNINRCDLDPVGLWTVTVVSGKIATTDADGAAWDALGGAPDPRVCIGLNSSSSRPCTTAPSDTFTPSWNETLLTATANDLRKGVTVSVDDVDVSANDPIVSASSLGVELADFKSRSLDFGNTYASIKVTLTPKP